MSTPVAVYLQDAHPIREAMVMTLETSLGPDGNTFEESPEQCHSLSIPGPILSNNELAAIARVSDGVFDPCRIDMCAVPRIEILQKLQIAIADRNERHPQAADRLASARAQRPAAARVDRSLRAVRQPVRGSVDNSHPEVQTAAVW